MSQLLTIPAIKLAEMIRNKKVTSEEVIQTYISQAKRVNPLLNAIVHDRFDLALREAKEVDQFLKSDPDVVAPLLGVPVTLKECFLLKGMPQTIGIVSRRNMISDQDATIVSRLKAAGAIPLGITNVSIALMHWETDNKLYGRTNNPYNLDHTPAGSSGGEGAIIGSAGSVFGIGSDIGGSIRLPAAFCGIFGHKPSPGLVPRTGSYPEGEASLESMALGNIYAACGPLARYSEDLMPILKIISGPDQLDLGIVDMPLVNVDDVQMADQIYYYFDHQDLHEDVKKAHETTIEILKRTGAKVQMIDMGKFEQAAEIFFASLSKASTNESISKRLGGGQAIDLAAELEKEKTGDSEFPFYILLMLSNRGNMPEQVANNLLAMGTEFRQEFANLLGSNGVLIYPTFPLPAIKHGQALTVPQRIAFTGIFNILGCPVTAFPVGLSKEGLPMGMQAVARGGNDHLTIAVAKHMEASGFRWTPPKLAGLD